MFESWAQILVLRLVNVGDVAAPEALLVQVVALGERAGTGCCAGMQLLSFPPPTSWRPFLVILPAPRRRGS